MNQQLLKNRAKVANWQENNRTKYNDYMRGYMNERNRRIREEGTPEEQAKARRQNTEQCRKKRQRRRAKRIAREAEETRKLILSEGGDPSQL